MQGRVDDARLIAAMRIPHETTDQMVEPPAAERIAAVLGKPPTFRRRQGRHHPHRASLTASQIQTWLGRPLEIV